MNTQACTNRQSTLHRGGFTLLELTVTIGIIILVATIALPSISRMLSMGADAQAYNLISAQITVARALAVESGDYAGIHVQPASTTATPTKIRGKCYSAVIRYSQGDPSDSDADLRKKAFAIAEGYAPRRMPSDMVFGELSSDFIGFSVSSPEGEYDNSILNPSDDNTINNQSLQDFCTFSIVFSAFGNPVTSIGSSNNVEFRDPDKNTSNSQLQRQQAVFAGGSTYLWDFDLAEGEPPVKNLTMFNMSELKPLSTQNERQDYLDENGQIHCINPYTGQLSERQ